MAVNKWLNGNNFPRQELDLYQSLVDESIQMKGTDVRYLVRSMENRDFLFGESTVSSFADYFVVEMYLADVENFNGDGALFGMHGLEMTDQATFEVSIPRFKTEALGYQLDRPREGDLIYLDYANNLYEITKVKNDPEFMKLGKNYRYVLKCKLFVYSHEQMPTDGPEADATDFWTLKEDDGIRQTLGLSPSNMNDEGELIDAEAKKAISPSFSEDDPFGGR